MKNAVVSDTLLCTVLLVDKDRSLYTELRDGRYRLLRFVAPTMQRIASVIQAEIYRRFELHCVILDYPPNPDRNSCCAVAYLLSRMHDGVRLVQTSIDQITEEDLSEIQRKYLADLLGDRIADPLCRIAWFDETMKWIESVMGVPPERQGPIVQMELSSYSGISPSESKARRRFAKATQAGFAWLPSLTPQKMPSSVKT
jgi:hypothetical protein